MRIPRATYRVQLNGGFTFSDAAGIVPYLDELCVSHLYTSPYTRSREGSSHGYDVADHNELDPELGGPEGYEFLTSALSERGMGHILDFVPNHMGVGPDNHRWLDVLENGPASRYAHFFDIDWGSGHHGMRGKILLPVLGDHYRAILENGELTLEFDRDSGVFSARYYEHRCPLDPKTYPLVLGDVSGAESEAGNELTSLAAAFAGLPARGETGPEAVEERSRDARGHRERLARFCAESPEAARHVEERLGSLNGDREELHHVLEEQAYRLAYWRVSSEEINYRRFFSIDDLAGIRVEDNRVFDAIHKLALELVERGELDGLRIDHIDGLYDPKGYLERLQSAAGEAPGEDGGEQNIYLLVEKILAGHERLPDDWPVAGTTGYEFAERLNGLFVDPAGEPGMECAYRGFLGGDYPDGLAFGEVLYRSKRYAMRTELASELNVLSLRLLAISEGTNAGIAPRRSYDFTLDSLRETLAEVVAAFPVYRSYIREGEISWDDRRNVEWAVSNAERRSDAADKSHFGFVREVLLGEDGTREVREFVARFQQFTGPVMAKGMEDTALYVFNRLGALNEVGGEPERFGVSVAEMHRENSSRAREWPHAMLSTSTHDTKRGEDVRARIDALSEMPDEWRGRLASWTGMNRRHRRETGRGPSPSRNDEYLLYQTLLGVWPLEDPAGEELEEFRGRVEGYMLKAAREAEVRTSWTNQDAEYEEALSDFISALLEYRDFLGEFLPFARRIARTGALSSLSQSLVKLTSPGVPDTYQGNELWDLSLVDPDNRRPVDYGLRSRMLGSLKERFTADGPGTARSLLSSVSWRDGGPKLHLTWRALSLRREREELFRHGEYLPLEVKGARADHVFAFARRLGDEAAVTVAPRLYARLVPDSGLLPDSALWEGTSVELPSGFPAPLRNVLTGEEIEGQRLPLESLLESYPVALLAAV